MSVRSKISVLIAGGLLALLLAGCSRDNSVATLAETDEPGYREGQQLTRQGRTHEALTAYRKVIEKRGEQASAESHLEVGIIMMQQIKNPLEAIYHFSKYLEQQPNSHQAPLVKDQLEAAKREFARTLGAQPLESQSQRLDVLEQIDRLQRENQLLKAELAATRSGPDSGRPVNAIRVPLNDPSPSRSAAPPPIAPSTNSSPIVWAPLDARENLPVAEPATAPAPPSSTAAGRGIRPLAKPTAPSKAAAPTGTRRSYAVAPGEGLWAIATKMYGSATSARVTAIVEANRDVLPNGASSLKPGMILKIP